MNISNLLANGSRILKSNSIKTHVLDSELILSDILKSQREKLNNKFRQYCFRRGYKKF
jgi:hypothetical protein